MRYLVRRRRSPGDAAPARREQMVGQQIAARRIRDPAVLTAMGEVPREEFVPDSLAEFAYVDAPLPIAEEQTISQPYVVALMIEALELRPGDRVLEIGTGSGYAAAVLSRIAAKVVSLERHASLAAAAAAALRRLGYDNVEVHHADGSLGWPDAAPYDAIVATAAPPEIPRPLLDQLAPGGRLVIPVGGAGDVQTLRRIRRTAAGKLEEEDLEPVQFVPLLPGTSGSTDRRP